MKPCLLLWMAVLTGSPAAAGEEDGFDYFANNWNVVGLRDYLHGSRVSPSNELWLSGRPPRSAWAATLRP